MVRHRNPPDEVLLNEPFEYRRIATRIPRTFRVDHGNWPAFADPEAVGLRTKNAARLRETKLLQPSLQVIPRREGPGAIAALRRGLIAAQKNMPPRAGHTDRTGYFLLPPELFAHNWWEKCRPKP